MGNDKASKKMKIAFLVEGSRSIISGVGMGNGWRLENVNSFAMCISLIPIARKRPEKQKNIFDIALQPCIY